MEQDRASHVLPHHPELARYAAPQPPHRHRTDRQHHDENRTENSLRTGSQRLSKGHQGLRRGNGEPQHNPRRIPSRMELQHRAAEPKHGAIVFGRRLMMPVSNDTLLRVVRRCGSPAFVAPSVIGIDDWAWRRNQRYGTIICDLERRKTMRCSRSRADDGAGVVIGPTADRHRRPRIVAAATPWRLRTRFPTPPRSLTAGI